MPVYVRLTLEAGQEQNHTTDFSQRKGYERTTVGDYSPPA